MDNNISDVYLSVMINKSNPGEMDSDGNYIFEVEASNENLDLQNQIVQQEALVKSKDYFLTNGVISDDHQHKTRDDDGNVETHKNKIIGEPLKIWTEGSRTFVKGKLYGNNKYAKEYINLLKAGSTRVHASVGGIMPKVRKNADGTETVTSFMWNDLALTCSPVNWTVGSAKFAKSLSNIDFCKALTAGSNIDPSVATDGEALKKESLEKKLVNILEAEAIEKKDDEDDENEVDSVIEETVKQVKKGNLNSETEVRAYLIGKGFTNIMAEDTAKEIMEQGETQMMKNGFFNSIKGKVEKSFGKKSEDCKKSEDNEKDETKESEKDDDNEADDDDGDTFDFGDDDNDEEDVKKSFESQYANADFVIGEMGKSIESLKDENEELRKSCEAAYEEIEELKKSVEYCADMISKIGNAPQIKKSVQVAIENPDYVDTYEAPTQEDFEIFKSVLCRAKADKDFKEVDLRKSVHLESVFQKAVNGTRMNEQDEKLVRKIYSKYNGGEQ